MKFRKCDEEKMQLRFLSVLKSRCLTHFYIENKLYTQLFEDFFFFVTKEHYFCFNPLHVCMCMVGYLAASLHQFALADACVCFHACVCASKEGA